MRDIAKHISLTLFILTAMIIYSGEGEGEVLVCFIQTCTSPPELIFGGIAGTGGRVKILSTA